MSKSTSKFTPLNICVLTLSDTRSLNEDSSGDYLASAIVDAGHNLYERELITDDKYQLRASASKWIADDKIHAIITTGGTGFTARDTTPEALEPLFDKTIDGFGELFRQLSFNIIGTSTIQSRAIAGLANNTLIACLPGSTSACKDAWKGILSDQLNSQFRPCNLVPHLLRKYN